MTPVPALIVSELTELNVGVWPLNDIGLHSL
jgi:hypothetical protein